MVIKLMDVSGGKIVKPVFKMHTTSAWTTADIKGFMNVTDERHLFNDPPDPGSA
jgi:hypothetical protein